MDEKEVQALIEKAIAPLKAENDELRKKFNASEDKALEFERQNKRLKSDAEEQKEAERKVKVKFAREHAEGVLEAAVKAATITPAQRESFAATYKLDNDESVLALDMEAFKKAFSVSEIPNKEGTGMSDPDANNREPNVFKEVERRVRAERAKDDKLDYNKAFRRVMTADPKLHAEYLDTDPPVHFQMGGAT